MTLALPLTGNREPVFSKSLAAFLKFSVFLLAMIIGNCAHAQITLIDPATVGGFESATTFGGNGWTVANGANTTRVWYCGTGQAGYSGARAAFIGNSATNVGANAANRVVHLYRPVTIPVGATNITLTFKYKQAVSDFVAPSTVYDGINVYLDPSTPVGGTTSTYPPIGSRIFGAFPTANVTSFTTQTVTIPNSYATGVATNLIFTWFSDNVTPTGYGAIDDVSLTYISGCSAPSQATGFGSNTVLTTSGNVTWTNGGGTNRLVVVRQGSAVNADPASGSTYTANPAFGSGSQIGTGNYVVYNGTGSSASVSNLLPNTQYFFAIYEFTGTCYNVTELTGSFTTASCSPSTQASAFASSNVYNNSATVSFTRGNGNRVIVLARNGSAVNADPVYNTSYTANANFGSGTQVGTGNYVVYDGTGNSVTVTGLTVGTTYHFAVYEYFTAPNCFKTPALTGNLTTTLVNPLVSGNVSCGYNFAYTTATTYTAVSGGTTVASGSGIDDNLYPNQTIGFPFDFNGKTYTSVGISSNGFIWFGATNPASTDYAPLSSATAMEGAISVFGDDLLARAAGSTIKTAVTGTAPNRVFTIEWLNFTDFGVYQDYLSFIVAFLDRYDFQIRLYEGSNNVDLAYNVAPYIINDIAGGQVGLRGTANTDFFNRKVYSCSNNWNTSTAGTLNSDVCEIDGYFCSTYPATNATYRFTPNVTNPTVTPNTPYTVSACNSYTLTSSSATSYLWYKDGVSTGVTTQSYNATASGVYYVRAGNASNCYRYSLPYTITINPNPTVFNVTGGTQCGSATVGLSGSESGVNYQLVRDGVNNVGSPVAGTGSSISFGVQSTAGTYTVVATNATTSCTSNMSGNSIVNPNPVAFNVFGGVGCGPIDVTTGGSQFNVNYQLKLDGTDQGSPLAGTGLGLDFGNQNTPGLYTVLATDASSGCTSTLSGSVTVQYCGAITWDGSAGTDWGVAANWTPPVVPSMCAQDVVIPNVSNKPVLSAPASVGSVQLDLGATLTLNANLNMCGNWVGSSGASSQVLGNGELILNGTGAQTLSGNSQFNILRLNNASGASIISGGTFQIQDEVDLQSGNLNTTGGTLIFNSASANQIAILDDFSSGYTGTITGDITARRAYNSAAYQDAHYFGSPVSGPTAGNLGSSNGSGGFVTAMGNCDETQLANNSLYGNVYTYDETNGGTCNVAGWKVEAAGNGVVAGKGYSVRKVGAGTLVLSGTPHTAASYSQSGTNSGWLNVSLQGRPTVSGWTMVANPYLATLDLTSAPIPAGFDAVHAVWNTTGPFAGTYTDEDIIAPFQAFFVRKSNPGGSATYTINKGNLSKNPQTFQALNNAETMTLYVTNNGNGLKDKTTVGFSSDATTQFDSQMDGFKMPGALTRHTLYSYNADPQEWFARNFNTSIEQTSTVNVGFEPGANGSYSMNFDGLQSFDPTSYITLEDKKTGTMHDVRSGDYSFTATTTDNWNRFVLHFTPAAKVNTSNATCAAQGQISITQPGSANWNYTLTNSANVVISSGNLNQSSPVTVSAAAGVYTITLTDANNYTVVKNLQITGASPIAASMTASSTIAETGEDINFTSTTANATNIEWNFGDNTTATTANASHSYTTEGSYNVSLTVTNADGCSSTTSQMVTVTAKSATGINNLTDGKLNIWSNANRVYVDFSKQKVSDATIDIYNVLGQKVSSEKWGKSSIYSRELNNLDAGYVIVNVKTELGVSTKKVFITNTK